MLCDPFLQNCIGDFSFILIVVQNWLRENNLHLPAIVSGDAQYKGLLFHVQTKMENIKILSFFFYEKTFISMRTESSDNTHESQVTWSASPIGC